MLLSYLPPMSLDIIYKKLKPWLDAIRERYNDSSVYDGIDLLYKEAIKLQPDLKIPDVIPLFRQTRSQE
jgi:hypothetical protein